MNHKTNKYRNPAPGPWRHQSPGSSGNWFQQRSGLRASSTNKKPSLHRIGGHRPHLLDRRIFQLDHDGQRPIKEKTAQRVARLLRKFRVQPDCRWVRTRTVARPWLELASPPKHMVVPSAVAPLLEQGPLDTWGAVQDLWRRLDVICPSTVFLQEDRFELDFENVDAEDWDEDSMALIDQAREPNSYRWRHEGQQGDLVQFTKMRGNDLLVSLTSIQRIARWPEGQEIVGLVRSYLTQIRNRMSMVSDHPTNTP